jgi:uncharacterized protein (TIGR02466 family)
MSLNYLFPTPIWQDPATLSNYDPVQLEIQAVLKKILEEDNLDDVSDIYKDAGERNKDHVHGYIIKNNIIKNHNMAKLEERIYTAIERYTSAVDWTALSKYNDELKVDGEWKIMNSWINIAEKGVRHDFHSHPGYTIAGVYYFRVNAEQGGIAFNNPNPIVFNAGFPEGRTTPQTLEVVPRDGDIILFPAWLQHGTYENQSEEDRVSIAFNIDFVEKRKD